jgi:acyl carrier protein
LRNERGRLVDTVLRFHEQHGAAIERAVPSYRPSDEVNQGFGVLVKYDIHRRRRNEVRVESVAETAGLAEDVAGFVVAAVTSILHGVGPGEIDLTQPLFELGLDSADLLDLNERIGSHFGVTLEAAFFFEHNTCERIISGIRELMRTRYRGVEDTNAATESASERADERVAGADEYRAGESAHSSATDRKEDVAVVGVACLLPGGIEDPEQFWKLLEAGHEAIGRLPPWRWTWPSNIDPDKQHLGIDIGGFAEGIEKFDAGFFRISPREAAVMDPQQRILLQLTWACLEDAGQVPLSLAGSRTGVFVGASGSDYQLRLSEEMRDEIDGHFGLATSMAILANRLSYFYDLTGPSIQIDGACSSSLVAVHEAVKSINTGQCSQALVAGINIMCHPANSVAYYKAGMLATDGKCKTFDKAANGYVRGEGAIVMLLKPLHSAMRDGNRGPDSAEPCATG